MLQNVKSISLLLHAWKMRDFPSQLWRLWKPRTHETTAWRACVNKKRNWAKWYHMCKIDLTAWICVATNWVNFATLQKGTFAEISIKLIQTFCLLSKHITAIICINDTYKYNCSASQRLVIGFANPNFYFKIYFSNPSAKQCLLSNWAANYVSHILFKLLS